MIERNNKENRQKSMRVRGVGMKGVSGDVGGNEDESDNGDATTDVDEFVWYESRLEVGDIWGRSDGAWEHRRR